MRWIQVATFTLVLAGCGGHVAYPEAQSVTDAGGGRFWAAGSEGLAGYYDGRALVRRDYPRSNTDDDRAYAASSDVATARVRLVGGEPYLFTRHADLLVWREPGGWTRLPWPLPRDEWSGTSQVNEVLTAPDGSLVVQLLGKTFLFAATPADLSAGRVRTELAPTYFTWVGFVSDQLFGVGWDVGGNLRALWRRQADGWHQLALLGKTESNGFAGVVRLPAGPIAVARWEGLLVPAGAAEPDRVTLQHLGLADDVYAFGAATATEHGPLLLVGGRTPGALELGRGVHRLWTVGRRDIEGRVIGAVPLAAGMRLVTSTPVVYDVPEATSVAEAPILVR